jgi:hypothetical protein
VWVLDRPVYLLFLLVLPVLFYLRHVRPSRGGRLVVPFSVSDAITFHPPVTFRVFVIRLTTAMFWAGLICSSWLSPDPPGRSANGSISVEESTSCSSSTSRRAWRPRISVPVNRFETARSVIRRFVEQRPNRPYRSCRLQRRGGASVASDAQL